MFTGQAFNLQKVLGVGQACGHWDSYSEFVATGLAYLQEP